MMYELFNDYLQKVKKVYNNKSLRDKKLITDIKKFNLQL